MKGSVVEPVGAEATTDIPEPGDLLAGKYRVDALLGQGGMGVVLAVEHMELGQGMAIKLLLPSAARDAVAVTRFLREARAAAALQSEHVVRIYDVGTLETGSPFIVMELMRGQDLSDYLAHKGPLPVEEAVDFVYQACHAVAEAHQKGLVHRDLKPSNLFLTHRSNGAPHVKVLDFGISKALETQSSMISQNLTATSAVMGSPLYMSPEQVRNAKHVDVRSDIWSLGIILHELLAGSPAFQADTLPAICAAIIADPTPALTSLRADVPVEIEAVVARCLEKDITRRYQCVEELMEALAPFAPDSVQRSSAGRFHPSRPRTSVPASCERMGLDAAGHHEDELLASRPDSRAKAARPFAAPVQIVDTQVSTTGLTTPPHWLKRPPPLPTVTGSGHSAHSAPGVASRTLPSIPPPIRRNPWTPRMLGATLATLVSLAVVVFLIRQKSRRQESLDASVSTVAIGQPASAAGASPSQAASSSASAGRATYELLVDSNPPDAEVSEGQAVLGTTPLRLRIDNAGARQAPRRLLVHREGYSSYEFERGPSDEDVRIIATLSPAIPVAATRPNSATGLPHSHRSKRPADDRPLPSSVQKPPSPATAAPPSAPQEPRSSPDDIRLER